MKLLPPYSITLLLPAFHPVLDVVVLGRMTFDFRAGGEVAASYESLVSSTGMYKTTSDFVRAGFEVLLLLWTTLQLTRELKEIVSVSAMEYLQNMFNWLDLGSIAAVYFGACLYVTPFPQCIFVTSCLYAPAYLATKRVLMRMAQVRGYCQQHVAVPQHQVHRGVRALERRRVHRDVLRQAVLHPGAA